MECTRVLKPGGQMLVFMTFATNLLEPQEALRLYAPLAIVPENMSTEHFENAVQGSGLGIIERSVIGSEWREWREEEGDRQTSKQLLYIARMMRTRERLICELGSKLFENILADCYWGSTSCWGNYAPCSTY
ncbi:MAG: hypothetical protein A2Z21_05735 [Candidatus Fraserbacteria bacterium RBG_16_55_9]|uniref:Methyltransferase type 11 domain-containing protein n=1 Tax=Fraserbacteria sp. (strain RBG_16_55_9) TaxID=1817864 RepID=A0A1F5UPM6_FRAXR|nr:MAG: hypothetical protein A2Z21_05735 [Candidatus Fraserbacteria bacterium RBG_16_55_9]